MAELKVDLAMTHDELAAAVDAYVDTAIAQMAAPAIQMDAEARYAELELERRRLKAALAIIEDEQTDLAGRILATWEQRGITKASLNGLTLYVQRQVYYGAKDGDKARLVGALEAHGLRELVTYNSQSLSSFVREQEGLGLSLPPDLADALTESERFNLRVRKA